MDEEQLRIAVAAAVEPLAMQLSSLCTQMEELKAKLEPSEPETAYQDQAAQILGVNTRTLQRRRKSWIEGVHWWCEDGGDRPIYNLALIRDGQRQGFDSPAHILACQRWLKSRPGSRKA